MKKDRGEKESMQKRKKERKATEGVEQFEDLMRMEKDKCSRRKYQ